MKLTVLSAIAKLLGIQFHFEGHPYGGAARDISSADVS